MAVAPRVIKVQDLQQRQAITSSEGNPTNYFMKYVNDRNGNILDLSTNLDLKVDKTTQVIAGVGLSGGGSFENGDITIDLEDTAVTPGTYGDSTHYPIFTVDQQGRLTAASQSTFAGPNYLLGFFATTAPTASEVLCLHTAASALTIPANFGSPASLGDVGTNPTATFTITVAQNGSTIGTITISTGGAFTFATSGGTAKAIAAGDVLRFTAQAGLDATIANISITVVGTT